MRALSGVLHQSSYLALRDLASAPRCIPRHSVQFFAQSVANEVPVDLGARGVLGGRCAHRL